MCKIVFVLSAHFFIKINNLWDFKDFIYENKKMDRLMLIWNNEKFRRKLGVLKLRK